MRAQMMRVISSPSSSATGLATLILFIRASESSVRRGIATRPKPVKETNARAVYHSLTSAIGREYRRRGAGDGEFCPHRSQAGEAAAWLARLEGHCHGRWLSD